MALPTSPASISLNQIHVEAGGASGTQASINDADIRALIGKASGVQMSFSEWYGASAVQTYIITTEGSYYGYIGYDNNPTFGAINSSSYVDTAGNTRGIYRIIYGHSSGGLYFTLTPDSPTGASAFSKISINCGGTYYDFARTRATQAIASGTYVQWNWSLSVLTAAEETALNGQLDGSGTTTFQIHN